MLVKGVTFFSSSTIALKVLFDPMFLTVIMSPICPALIASPYVTTEIFLFPTTIMTVSSLLTLLRYLTCLDLTIVPFDKFVVTFLPIK